MSGTEEIWTMDPVIITRSRDPFKLKCLPGLNESDSGYGVCCCEVRWHSYGRCHCLWRSVFPCKVWLCHSDVTEESSLRWARGSHRCERSCKQSRTAWLWSWTHHELSHVGNYIPHDTALYLSKSWVLNSFVLEPITCLEDVNRVITSS